MAPVEPRTARRIDVLLVEDNPNDRELLMEALEDSEVRKDIHIARDGVEAMEFLTRQGAHSNAPTPDLVVLDLNMPRKNGLEVLREMKADPNLHHIPVIVLTTSKAEEDVREAYKLNAAAYVTKPVDFEAFVDAVQAIDDFWLQRVQYAPKHGEHPVTNGV